MIKDFLTQQSITYEDYGFTRKMVKGDASRFKVDPVLHRDIRLGEDIITNPANVGPGTILRGSLAVKAKATPFIIHTSQNQPYQVATAISQSAANLIVSISGPTSGNPNYLDGWQLYGEFPIKDRIAIHNSLLEPKGITIDENYVYIGEGTKIYRMPHNFSSITEITPSGTTIPAINGLTSDGNYLYTTNGTAFYKITISGTTYAWTTQATLVFPIAKIGCFTGKYFIGYDNTNSLIREWQLDGSLWRDIPFAEPNFIGVLMINGFPYLATQIGSAAEVQLLPLRI